MKKINIYSYIPIIIGCVIGVLVALPSLREKVLYIFKSKPYVELTGNNNLYQLNITGFSWGYGTVSINQFTGDFDKLDEEVFTTLKGKDGYCRVYIEDNRTDKYGNTNNNNQYIGNIDIDELNKYQDWQYWRNGDGGIKKLLYKSLVGKNSFQRDSTTYTDTTRRDITPVRMDTTSVKAYNSTSTTQRVYSFSIDRLYPLQNDRDGLDSSRFEEDGKITSINYDNGLMQIQTADELLDVQFYPLDASSETQNELKIALKVGNHIRSICATAGASTLDLVAAKITTTR